MKEHKLRSMGFGVTSGVITTLGLMSGLNAATNSKLVVLGGIISIAVADALSDALGIHISEESVSNDKKTVWESTILTFLFKFFVALTFTVPVLICPLDLSIIVNIVWGFLLITLLSGFLANRKKENALFAILEHLSIATFVIIVTRLVGLGVKLFFS